MSGISKHFPLRVAVVDGDDPQGWPLFGKTLGALAKQLEAEVLPTRHVRDDNMAVSASILMNPHEDLLKDSGLRSVIGLLVDGVGMVSSASAHELTARIETITRICQKLSKTENAVYRQTGFYVWLVVPFPKEEIDHTYQARVIDNVRTTTSYRLGLQGNAINVSRIPEYAALCWGLRSVVDSAAGLVEAE